MTAEDTEKRVNEILESDKSRQIKAESLKTVRDFYLRAPDPNKHMINGNEFWLDDHSELKNAGITVKDLLGAGYAQVMLWRACKMI